MRATDSSSTALGPTEATATRSSRNPNERTTVQAARYAEKAQAESTVALQTRFKQPQTESSRKSVAAKSDAAPDSTSESSATVLKGYIPPQTAPRNFTPYSIGQPFLRKPRSTVTRTKRMAPLCSFASVSTQMNLLALQTPPHQQYLRRPQRRKECCITPQHQQHPVERGRR